MSPVGVETLSSAVAVARAAWPDVVLDAAAFEAHLQRHAADAAAVAACHAADLFLALGCARGDTAALRAFERDLLSKVPAFLAKMNLPSTEVDEVRQTLRQKLFVAAGEEPPKILTYSGRGPLEGWLRIVTVNTALKRLRPTRPDAPLAEPFESLASRASAHADSETDYLKSRYRGDFEAALADGFAALEPKSRNVLRLAFLDGLTIDQIGAAYGAHRATAARWLAAAREDLLKRTRELLRQRLRLSREEIDSMVGLVKSRLEVSLHELLETRTA